MLLQDNGSLIRNEEEEAVNFTCSFSRNENIENIGLDIKWTVDGERVCDGQMENIQCFSAEGSDTKQSVLAIQKTRSPMPRNYVVVCTVQFTGLNELAMDFRNDQSYNANDLTVRRRATFTVSPVVIPSGILLVYCLSSVLTSKSHS